MSQRAGRYVPQPGGYRAFRPAPLPPTPPVRIGEQLQVLLSEADRGIGRVDAATELLPNPDLFVAMYVRREAVYSSQIEGTQASLADLLEFEAEGARAGHPPDVGEVVNYVRALNHGLARLPELPLSVRLIRQIHADLMRGVRGGERSPGEFRRIQNWIGPSGSDIAQAIYVPPPPQDVPAAMAELERYLHADDPVPILVKCGIAHAQFETIHPFLDGNGRVGRLLITFLLCWKGILRRPLLYLSAYFKRNRTEYYARLQAVRDHGDWEGWMEFFLTGVREVAKDAVDTARRIQQLREEHRTLVGREIPGTPSGLVLLDALFRTPVVSVKGAAKLLKRSYPAANDLVARFESLGILRETTGGARNRLYAYRPYMQLFEQS